MKLVGERRALAALVFVFYALLFFVQGLLGPDQVQGAFYALAGCYGLAFFALVAGYFWARWHAVGLAMFGLILAAVGTWQMGGIEPVLMFLGGTHLAAALMLWGEKMSEPFEGQLGWREK